jgi:hypothetical protein
LLESKIEAIGKDLSVIFEKLDENINGTDKLQLEAIDLLRKKVEQLESELNEIHPKIT